MSYRDGAGCTVLATRITWYNCALVDLSRRRSVHALEHEPCCPDPSKLSSSECRAVHYGLCSPLLKLPPFSLPPATTQRRDSDPWDDLVNDIEHQLKDVVSHFVTTDKSRKINEQQIFAKQQRAAQQFVPRSDATLSNGNYNKQDAKHVVNFHPNPAQQADNDFEDALERFKYYSKCVDKTPSIAVNDGERSLNHISSQVYRPIPVRQQENANIAKSIPTIEKYTPICENGVNVKNRSNGELHGTVSCNRALPEVPERTTSAGKLQVLQKPSTTSLQDSRKIVPHPKLTSVQKQHIRERSPIERFHGYSFVNKGSVAERVLQFERCPDVALERATKVKTGLHNTAKTVDQVHSHRSQSFYSYKDKDSIQLHLSNLYRLPPDITCSIKIPRFYYPHGCPLSSYDAEEQLQSIAIAFLNFSDRNVPKDQFGIITKACGLPLYWKVPLFLAAGGEKSGSINCDTFLDSWKRVINVCHDQPSQFICILAQGTRNYLLPEDFVPMMQDIINTHPGLTFLKEATEFHSRYVQTVIARIYYCVNRSWSGRITAPELRKSDFLQVIALLEEEEDINLITEYFSYEHFYVIYCKFWELDTDHDLFIDKNDLSHHSDGAISSRMIDRIFSGAVTRGSVQKKGKMSYAEFVWFLISEEDKRHPRSIEYWFRCMDLDGDGFLSMYELEYFYDEQLQRMEALGIETLPFKDCLCQMLDMVRPKIPGKISLSDLKQCKMTPVFFDTFFNLEKFLDHEQRDPFASQRDQTDGVDISDWDIYAAEEYEILIAEEGIQTDPYSYEDTDQDMDDYSHSLGKFNLSSILHNKTRNFMDIDDEDYDYAESDADYPY